VVAKNISERPVSLLLKLQRWTAAFQAAAAALPETVDEPEEPDAAIEIADEDELADIGEAESEEAAA
jgi:hypothetical protein